MAKKKKPKWIKFRHRVVRNLAFAVLYPYSRLKYGLRVERFRRQGDRKYLILFNHQTAFDQFFVGMCFKGPVYYIASEDLFSMGFASKLIRYLVAPIPINKQATDVTAVMNAMRVAREGGTIALAPEGNRTFSGKTEYIKPSIAPLIRALKMPVAICRIEGGYGAHPRWSDVVRRGKVRSYVSEVIEPEEWKALSDDALYERVCRALEQDEGCLDHEYPHKRSAEYLERAMYVCHRCGLSEFESHGTRIRCKLCGEEIEYLPTKELVSAEEGFPFRFVTEWYRYQCDYVNSLAPADFGEELIYGDDVELSEVEICKKKKRITSSASLSLYADRITLEAKEINLTMPMEDIRVVTILGKNKLNFYYGDKIYQVKGEKRFNALKYLNLYHRFTNVRKGDPANEFLGL